jgi:adenylosuccinate synthase
MGLDHDRIVVDPRAVLVTEEDRAAERRCLESIASTCSGTGAAAARRMSRQSDLLFAKDSARIVERCRVEAVAPVLHDALDAGSEVVVEGTQGFSLSLLHGPDYPYVTSRDTTASGFAMEVGLSPRVIDEIVMVVRTFPIRVGGPSGPFADEISWEEIRSISGAPAVLPEYTSVTKSLRRVARFDTASVIKACRYNRPTSLAVMGMDRVNYADTGVRAFEGLSRRSRGFIEQLELATGVPVEFAGTGFGTFDVASAHFLVAQNDHLCLK